MRNKWDLVFELFGKIEFLISDVIREEKERVILVIFTHTQRENELNVLVDSSLIQKLNSNINPLVYLISFYKCSTTTIVEK